MIIRKARIDDAESIAKLTIASRRKAYLDIFPTHVMDQEIVTEKRISAWKERISDDNDHLLVAEDDNKGLLGVLWGGEYNEHEIPYKFEIHALYADTEHQRQGIGHLLMNEFKRLINNQPFFLYMLKGNASYGFYSRMGGIERPEFEITKPIREWNSRQIMFSFDY